MSFAGGGADCGPTNPMSGLLKQFGQDRSLQQDRFMGGQRGESSKASFRSKPGEGSLAERQLAEEFLRDDGLRERTQDVFKFNGLGRELENIHMQPSVPGPESMATDWSSDFLRHQAHQQPSKESFSEFEAIYQRDHMPATAHQWQSDFETFQQSPAGAHTVLTPVEREAFERAFDQAKQGANVDWEKEFAAQESWASEFVQQEDNMVDVNDNDALAKTAERLLESVSVHDNPKLKNSQFMNLMQRLSKREVSIQGDKMVETSNGGDWASEFGKQQNAGPQTVRESWTDEFVQHATGAPSGAMWSNEYARTAERGWSEDMSMNAPLAEETTQPPFAAQDALHSDSDWVQQYQRNIAHLKTTQDAEWDSMQKDWDRFKPEQGSGYRADQAQYDTYTFSTENPYLLDSSAIANADRASLPDTILALEARAQLQVSDATAWQELGFRQQENERDAAAIAALRRAVALNPSLLDGWLSLAVSYINENCRLDAYDCLEQWLANNEKYKALVQPGQRKEVSVEGRHDHVMHLFLEAARSAPGEEMDADVQVGLGVLLNMSGEYHKAIDCFKAALVSRPKDYLLWNKLGASLANSRDTMGAIEAYSEALNINESYIRARCNLAISKINLGWHREAAEDLLISLSLQQDGDAALASGGTDASNNKSNSVWDALRMVMLLLNREDLATACDRRHLDAFRSEFTFWP